MSSQRDQYTTLGAWMADGAAHFRVWAPKAADVTVRIESASPGLEVPLNRAERGYFHGVVQGLTAGTRYRYVLNGSDPRPDPASRFQPQGVHGPSELVDHSRFPWSDHEWRGVPFEKLVIYELHVGTFTRQGTFESVIPYLPYLRDELGITAIELMPVAQFPGSRNWGYDGVGLYAPQSTYGGPDGLKRLVDAAHGAGLGVVLDVVYNHLGPEGNYLSDFGPYFTDRYRTPWGPAVNYDGPDSDAVREYVVANAAYWIREYHMDGLRLDAVHGIYDFGARHILRDIGEAVRQEGQQSGRYVFVIAESDLNDPRVIESPVAGGHGLEGQWSDDFHHAVHARLTGERAGYYEDFGTLDQVARSLEHGFVYAGQYSAHRRRRHGAPLQHRPPAQLVVCTQNHDQVGNRAQGERLSALVPRGALHVAAAMVLLSPNTPLLFMGEEYAERAPFLYFVDHSDPELIEAVRRGRREEFKAFGWTTVPDPADPKTFESSRLALGPPTDPLGSLKDEQRRLLRWYAALLHLRKSVPALGPSIEPATGLRAWAAHDTVFVHRWDREGPSALILANFSGADVRTTVTEPEGRWVRKMTSDDPLYGGSGRGQAPDRIDVTAGGPVTVALQPYEAVVYLTAEREAG